MINRLLIPTITITCLSLSGCSTESKMQSACEKLIKAVVTDPSSTKINSVSIIRSDMTREEAQRDVGKGGRYRTEYVDNIYDSGQTLENHSVLMDITTTETFGPMRGQAVCVFKDDALKKGIDIAIVEVFGEPHHPDNIQLFHRSSWPNELDNKGTLK